MSIVLGLSGGIDSAVLLAMAKHRQEKVVAVNFQYGSKHNPFERPAADALAKYYEVPLYEIDLKSAFQFTDSALLEKGAPLPEGHYEDESMRATVIPSRNLMFASILASGAQTQGFDAVWMGMHMGDALIYPDCRASWVDSVARALSIQTEGMLHLDAPLLEYDKIAVIKKGLELKVPFQFTRTCYAMQEKACGRCGSCNERKAGFAANGVEDPIEYEYAGPCPVKTS